MNSLFAIAPYKLNGTWVFDDPAVGLRQEPFVSGADDIMELLSADLNHPERGFRLIFSAAPFPGYSARFIWNRAEHGGNWYTWPEKKIEGWLCPALGKYFSSPPPEIYVKASPQVR